MTEPRLEIRGLAKNWGKLAALKNIDLAIPAGTFVSLLGPSGCGKTTLLRLITGSLSPDGGQILIDGEDITDLPTHRRNMGMVFQNFALFPHLTVAENVAFPMRVRGASPETCTARMKEALSMVHLDAYSDRYPRQLSGGQQQRVGLARAIVYRPTILLLDEPLSNLDAALREEMRIEISQVTRRLGMTSVYVTHDQREALALSDTIALMHQGHIVQVGRPEDIYLRPASDFVAHFVGYANAIPVTVGNGMARLDGREEILTGFADQGIAGPGMAFFHASDVTLGPSSAVGVNHVACQVEEVAFMGDHLEYILADMYGLRLKVHAPIGGIVYERGADVSAELPTGKVVLVPRLNG